MKKLLLMVGVFFVGASEARIHCVCDIGDFRPEQPAYDIGCSIWLSKTQCNTIKRIDLKPGENLKQHLPYMFPGDTLKLSYVGHWISSEHTEAFVSKHLVPLVQEKELHVVYDNTACDPMDDPEGVQQFLMGLDLPEESSIMVMGSQSTSMGMWDPILLGKSNFYAYASTEWSHPGFWNCKKIENEMCYQRYHKGESGRCFDADLKRLVTLTCKKAPQLRHNYAWQR